MQKTVLITGATSGIGEATAKILSENGYRLILTGRRKERLEALRNMRVTHYQTDVCTLVFDIRNFDSVKAALDSIQPEFSKVDVLINNAGLAAGLNKLHEGDLDDWEQMIDTNIKGLLYITRLVSPGMVERKKGHIINISSIAGRETYPNGNVYCATKYAVESLTRAMRIDMLPYGIKVSAISPGAVNTEFSLVRFKGDKSRAESVYQGFTPLNARDVAEAILFVVSRPEEVNIDDILIMPKAQAYSRDFHRNG